MLTDINLAPTLFHQKKTAIKVTEAVEEHSRQPAAHSLQHGVPLFLGRGLVVTELALPALHVLFVLLLGLLGVELVFGRVSRRDLLLQRSFAGDVGLDLSTAKRTD